MKENVKKILDNLYVTYPALKECDNDITNIFTILKNCYENDGKLLICGNGGSSCDCEHISGELLKSFKIKRPLCDRKRKALKQLENGEYIADRLEEGLISIPLVSFTGVNTAFANDAAPELVYAQLVNVMGRKGDVVLGISTSGNSANVVYALNVAKAYGLKTVGLAGRTGGKLKEICDACVCVPAKETFAVQEYHLPVYHALCAMFEEEFFGD